MFVRCVACVRPAWLVLLRSVGNTTGPGHGHRRCRAASSAAHLQSSARFLRSAAAAKSVDFHCDSSSCMRRNFCRSPSSFALRGSSSAAAWTLSCRRLYVGYCCLNCRAREWSPSSWLRATVSALDCWLAETAACRGFDVDALVDSRLIGRRSRSRTAASASGAELVVRLDPL